jgi:hypothetical protein
MPHSFFRSLCLWPTSTCSCSRRIVQYGCHRCTLLGRYKDDSEQDRGAMLYNTEGHYRIFALHCSVLLTTPLQVGGSVSLLLHTGQLLVVLRVMIRGGKGTRNRFRLRSFEAYVSTWCVWCTPVEWAELWMIMAATYLEDSDNSSMTRM